MIDLTRYLTRERLVPLGPAPRDALLRRLVAAALGAEAASPPAGLPDLAELLRGFKDQELGQGFVLTHMRVPFGDDIRLGVGLFGRPAAFGRIADVHTVICALIPDRCSREYLSLMARLSRLLSTAAAAEAFRAGEPDRVLDTIRTFQT